MKTEKYAKALIISDLWKIEGKTSNRQNKQGLKRPEDFFYL